MTYDYLSLEELEAQLKLIDAKLETLLNTKDELDERRIDLLERISLLRKYL